MDLHRCAGLEHVGLLSTTSKLHARDLGLAGSPSSLARLRQIGGRLRLRAAGYGPPTAVAGDRKRFVLSPGDVEQISVDDALRIALRTDPTAVEPQRLVTEPRHHVDRMGH